MDCNNTYTVCEGCPKKPRDPFARSEARAWVPYCHRCDPHQCDIDRKVGEILRAEAIGKECAKIYGLDNEDSPPLRQLSGYKPQSNIYILALRMEIEALNRESKLVRTWNVDSVKKALNYFENSPRSFQRY
jgi:hypothetical protein